MVEGARLESVYTRKGIEGSNPSVSAGGTNKEKGCLSLFVALNTCPSAIRLNMK